MRQIVIIFTALLLFGIKGSTQLIITPGATWANTGAVFVTLENIDLVNNGTFSSGNSMMWFSGSVNNTISSNSPIDFYDMMIAKSALNKISLLSNINVTSRVTFTSGLLDLNQNNINLATAAFLNNETENSHIIGPTGGEVIISVNMNAPNNLDAGSLGAIITDAANLGNVIIKRGHKSLTGAGLQSSIKRYFNIQPSNNVGLNSTLRFTYFDAELNGQNENTMILNKSVDNGINWTSQSVNSRDAVFNFVEKTGIPSFSIWTLSNPMVGLPVTGLQFSAKRINKDKVQLNWSTIQEINNKGFTIERKKENEPDYSNEGFVNSSAFNGNSIMPLSYSKMDDNNFSGTTLYRLKQQDIDGRFTYSVIRVVNGEINNTVTLKVWPIPSQGEPNIIIQGTAKGLVQVFDMSGKLVQQMIVTENTQQALKKLMRGNYIIRLAGQINVQQKIIVQ